MEISYACYMYTDARVFRIQCVVRTYDLKCVENANLTQKSIIDKSNLKFEICNIILRKAILFLTSMFILLLRSLPIAITVTLNHQGK